MAEIKKFPNEKYLYYAPQTCTHPQRIKEVIVIDENTSSPENSYTIAKLIYKSGEIRLAMRWNIAYDQYENPLCQDGKKVCLGFPHSRTYPTWFILPEDAHFSLSLSTISNKGE